MARTHANSIWPARSIRVFGIMCLLLAVVIAPLRSEDTTQDPYKLKAAFLWNFTKFVEWPAQAFEDARSPFRICILGENPFGSVLDDIVKGETLNGRTLVVEQLRRPPEPKACQILFLNAPSKEIPKTLALLGPGVLTVGEGDDFLRDGGIIAFVIENRHVRFDINQKAAGSAQLNISSRLFSVARVVRK